MPNPTTRPISVLVVEDNMDVADSIARFLRVAVGYDVRVAYDGLSGYRQAVANPPEVVICDIALPQLDGYAVVQEIVAALPVRPLFIAVTAYGAEHTEEKAKAAGFDFYLIKPADPFVLETLIRTRIRDPRLSSPDAAPPAN